MGLVSVPVRFLVRLYEVGCYPGPVLFVRHGVGVEDFSPSWSDVDVLDEDADQLPGLLWVCMVNVGGDVPGVFSESFPVADKGEFVDLVRAIFDS